MYRKPDNTYTEDSEEYIKAWEALILPVAHALGLQVAGFNPGAVFATHDYGATWNIDMWQLKVLHSFIVEASWMPSDVFQPTPQDVRQGIILLGADRKAEIHQDPDGSIPEGAAFWRKLALPPQQEEE